MATLVTLGEGPASSTPARPLRVALVYPPFHDKRDRAAYYTAPPLGLLYLAAYLEQAGHTVAVHDFILALQEGRLREERGLYRRCAEEVLAGEPDLVGFSTQCSTNPGSINIARLVKEARPGTAVLFGGHDVSFVAGAYLDAFPQIDFVLKGEAELTITRLADAVSRGSGVAGVPGLVYRGAGGGVAEGPAAPRVEDLDALLPPSYHLVPDLERYFAASREPTLLVDSGRGCSFRCEFCQTALLSGKGVRYRSVDSLVAELAEMARRHPGVSAYFVHDLFTARVDFVERLCQRLVEENLGVRWQCRCRIDQVSPELLRLMEAAGCNRLLYGIESGSAAMLQRMNKKVRGPVVEERVERVRWTVDAGIFPSLSMVVGTPEESLEDLSATMEMAAEFVKIGRVNAFIQLMSPLPGTALAERVRSRLEYRGESAPTAFSQGIEFWEGKRLPEDEALIAAWPDLFQSFYVVPPDHGDLDLCVDVTLAYCKLLEVYCYTFESVCRSRSTTHLDLFREWRDATLVLRGRDSLVGIKDHEIWTSFGEFVAALIAAGEVDAHVSDVFRYERDVHALAVADPVPDRPASVPIASGTPFRLRSAARLMRASTPLPWEPAAGAQPGTAGRRSYLVYMTPDRLRHVKLSEDLADVLDLLEEINREAPSADLYSAVGGLLGPLTELNVFEELR
ncbi:MAG TPA: radical SAM protein [Longimicrobiaceae bacterium]